jgi:hypothetical protein
VEDEDNARILADHSNLGTTDEDGKTVDTTDAAAIADADGTDDSTDG